MIKKSSLAVLMLVSALSVGFVIDLLLPLGISSVILYALVLVIAVRTPFPAYVIFHLCALVTVLICIVYNANASLVEDQPFIHINRVLAVIEVWVVGALCYMVKKGRTRLNEELETSKRKKSAMLHQSRLAGIGEMIGYAAHQWRQPLTTLHLIIFELKDMHERGELTNKTLNKLFNQSKILINSMSETIDDFRDFFRPVNYNKGNEPVPVVKTVKYVIKLISVSFQKNNIDLDLDLKFDAIVLGYRNEFSHALMNIIKNSKDAIRENNISEGHIWIRTSKRNDSSIVMEITDNGGGIQSSSLHQIFEPYFTTKERHGTGIGLYMTRVIIQDHMNGSITARNTITPYGKGAVIEIALPIVQESD